MTEALPSEQLQWRSSQSTFQTNWKRIQYAVLEKKPKIAKTQKFVTNRKKIASPPGQQINA